MRPRYSAALVVLLILVPACGNDKNIEQEMIDRINATRQRTMQYVYSETTEGKKIEVRGKIEDSARHSETLFIDGVRVLERVIYDDALAVQVLVPDQVPQIAAPEPADAAAAQALRDGQWVIDPAGAPPEGSSGQAIEKTGVDPLEDAANIFQYVRLSLDQAAQVNEFNPDDIDYRPKDDPFARPNKRAKEERFDFLSPPLPTRQQETSPGPASFRRMSLYVVANRVIRMLEQIDIDSQPEIRRARATGRNKFLLGLAAQVKQGRTDQRVREREMSFEIISQGTPLSVELPQQGFSGNLRVLFGKKEVAKEAAPDTSTPNP